MATTKEGLVKQKIKKLLNEYGALHFSPYMAGMGSAGVSDIIALYRGRFLAIEAKADSTKHPTELQKKFLLSVEFNEGIPMVIHKANIDVLREVLDNIDEEEDGNA